MGIALAFLGVILLGLWESYQEVEDLESRQLYYDDGTPVFSKKTLREMRDEE